VNYLGSDAPRILICLHEEHAVAIAQGYAMVTGAPLVAIVHSNVGLMHATMGVFDAWCARTPVVLLGATGPLDSEKRRPQIDWLHTSADQGALIRNYCKWDAQPGSPVAAVEAIRRAVNIARTPPCGPVYVNIDVDVQETELDAWPAFHDIGRYKQPTLSAPAPTDLDRAVDWLSKAKKIVMVSGRMARSEAAWNGRRRLAETLAAKVITGQTGASFPTHHPLHVGGANYLLGSKFLEEYRTADVILSLDPVDLGGHLKQAFPPGNPISAKIIHCSMDHQIHNGWSMDHQMLFPVDLHIATTPEMLVSALLDRLSPEESDTYSYEPRPAPAMPKLKGEIGLGDLAAVFRSVVRDEDVTLLGKPLGWPPDATPINHYLDYIGGNGGGGVGAGPGIAVGGALALRELGSKRLPVAILGDGDFLMGSNALWTAAANEIPLLVIVANNRSYFNDERHQLYIARRRGRPEKNSWVGLR
ncbi:MAG: thiamine pyrophosphate-binding protein, partial [Haliea sp.]